MVISVITLLVALLLPALAAARENAVRSQCLSDRRQLNNSTLFFAQDHRNRLPMATAFKDGNGASGLELSNLGPGRHQALTGGGSGSNTLGAGFFFYFGTNVNNDVAYPAATMARKGYIDSPNLLYCPAFERSPGLMSAFGTVPGAIVRYYMDRPQQFGYPRLWGGFTSSGLLDWNLIPGGQPGAGHMGISLQVYIPRSGTDSTPWTYPTFDDIADKWRADALWSPITQSCLQRGQGQSVGTIRQLLASGLWQSHKGQGVNASYFDGSARWVSLGEVQKDGWQADIGGGVGNPYAWRDESPVAFLVNDNAPREALSAATGNFISWSRRITSLSGR